MAKRVFFLSVSCIGWYPFYLLFASFILILSRKLLHNNYPSFCWRCSLYINISIYLFLFLSPSIWRNGYALIGVMYSMLLALWSHISSTSRTPMTWLGTRAKVIILNPRFSYLMLESMYISVSLQFFSLIYLLLGDSDCDERLVCPASQYVFIPFNLFRNPNGLCHHKRHHGYVPLSPYLSLYP